MMDEEQFIKTRRLLGKLPQAETIDYNPETKKFFVSPIPMQNIPFLSALFTHLSDVLEDALQVNNGLSKQSGEYCKINRAITRYDNNPQQAEITLTTVAKRLRWQIYKTNELPNCEANLALLDAIEQVVHGIRANHLQVGVYGLRLDLQTFRNFDEDDKRLLKQAQSVLIALSEGDLAQDFTEDISSLINDSLLSNEIPAVPEVDAATRLFSRVARIVLCCEDKGIELHDITAVIVGIGLKVLNEIPSLDKTPEIG